MKENTVLNREFAPTYRRSLREQLVQVLMTNTLTNTFYVSKRSIERETVKVMREAAREIPWFMAKALIYARNHGFMKLAPTLGLVVLSTARDKRYFQKAFDRVILIPDDLRNFVSFSLEGTIPGRKSLGGCAVPPVRNWLNGMSEYHAVKYGSVQSKGVTLRDIIRLSHPKPDSKKVEERFSWLVRGWKDIGSDPSPSNPLVWALERLKRTTDEDEAVALIRNNRLPFEVVVPTVAHTSLAIWKALLYSAPYFNLLRNLNTYARHGVFEETKNVEYAVGRLTNPEAIKRSKILPFRFFTARNAYLNSGNSNSLIADALEDALSLSFVNMPSLGNRTVAIGTDVSGSMTMFEINQQYDSNGYELPSKQGSKPLCIDIAGIFTAALLKKIEGRAIPLPFEQWVCENLGNSLSSRDSFMSITDRIREAGGGGTAVSAPIEHLLENNLKVDVFVGITDNEEWAYGDEFRASDGFLEAWRKYKQQINPKAKAFLLTLAPYRDAVAQPSEPGVHFIYGWSETVLKYIATQLSLGESQVDAVDAIIL